MNKNNLNINNSTRVMILWPLLKHRWENIIDFIENEIKLKIKNKLLVGTKIIDDKSWFDFILDVYKSHRAADGAESKHTLSIKIKKKIRCEFFGNISQENRSVLILIYDIEKDDRNKIIQKVKSICGHNDKRIDKNIKIKKRRNHCYDNNALKDTIRQKFKKDKKLPKHPRGVEYGRKRIAHCPESALGSRAVIDFIFSKSIIVNEY